MKRIYRPYTAWEEYQNGMWRIVPEVERKHFANQTAALMINVDQFEAAMRRALDEWPVSCKVHLSATVMNRQAWIGHAGCCVALGSPEDATRLGWHMLTQGQQDRANAAADRVIAEWEARNA